MSTGLFTITECNDPEEETFWVKHNRKGLEIICAETGNGGSERFELGWPKQHGEGYEPICFAPTRYCAEQLAKNELRLA
jgi:hypothetical protein